MPEQSLVTAMRGQFEQQWIMLREVLVNCPEDQWRVGPTDLLVPARLAFHVVHAAEGHLAPDPATHDWGRLGIRWADDPVEALLSRDGLGAFLDEVSAGIDARLTSLGDEGILGPDTEPQFYACVLDHLVYVLRHTQYHLGQLDAEMHRRGLASAKWR